MTREEIDQIIAENIRTNGQGEITAEVMAQVLVSMLDYTDTQSEDFATLVQALADTFQSWADELARQLNDKMDDTKQAALDAKAAAQSADTKSGEAKQAALDAKDSADSAKTLANNASAKAGWAKSSSDAAKTAAEAAAQAATGAETKAGQAKDSADLAKQSADDAKTMAQDAKTAGQHAADYALEAKTQAQSASTNASQAKTAANGAKDAINEAADGLAEALEIIRNGNGDSVVLPDGTKFKESTFTHLPAGLDFSLVHDGVSLFEGCEYLEEVTATISVTDATSAFRGCYALRTLSNFSMQGDATGIFDMCDMLEDVSNVSFDTTALDISSVYGLTSTSLAAIVNGLVAQTSPATLTVSQSQYDEIVLQGLDTVAQGKGWTIATY